MRVGAHTAFTLGSQSSQLFLECAPFVKQFLGTIALHPFFENLDVRGIVVHLSHWYLMGSPIALGTSAIDLLRARPTLRRFQYDHGPAWTLHAIFPRGGAYALNLGSNIVERSGHELVHLVRFMSLYKVGRVA